MSLSPADSLPQGRAQELFDDFVSASTCRAALWSFNQLCDHLKLDRNTIAERPLFRPIRSRLNYWKANALWRKLERRASQQEYQCSRGASSTTTVRTAPSRKSRPPQLWTDSRLLPLFLWLASVWWWVPGLVA